MDIVNFVDQFPHPGETIKTYETKYIPGGKGANQAVAAAKSGANVTMIGSLGNDVFSPALFAALKEHNICTEYILQSEGTSGLAFITVSKTGENSIIVSEGANGKVDIPYIDSVLFLIEKADAVLLQNEIPWETTRYVIQVAHERNVKVFFNPAPAFSVSKEIFPMIDVLVVNETEAEAITGISVNDEETALQAANKLLTYGVQAVLLTLGSNGSLYVEPTRMYRTPAFSVNAVDTTAAGDTFIGSFAVATSSKSIKEALIYASAASAISVTRYGAQSSIPTKEEIEEFLKS